MSALTAADIDRLDGVSRGATAAGGRGDFELAERGWTQIIDEMPSNAAAWSNRGNIRIGMNQIDAAIEDYTRSIELAPNITDPYINRGAAYEAVGEWDAAIADYNRALEIDERDPAIYNNRGNAKARQGLKAIATTYESKARACLTQGEDLNECLNAVKAGLIADPNYSNLLELEQEINQQLARG